MLEIYGLLELQADHEAYPDREFKSGRIAVIFRVGQAAVITSALWLTLQGASMSAPLAFEPVESVRQERLVKGGDLQSYDFHVSQVDLDQLTAEGVEFIDIDTITTADLTEQNWLILTQAKLSELNFYEGEVDGLWGPQTQLAVMRYQFTVGLEATGTVGNETKQSLFDGLSPAERIDQAVPLALREASDLLGGQIPDNGRFDGTAHWINGVPVNSHQYFRAHLSGAHRGVDLPHETGSPVYALGTIVRVWYDFGGGGLVVEQQHPNMPNVWIQSLHLNEAFGHDWTHWKAKASEPTYFNVLPEKLGEQVIAKTGSTGRNGAGDFGPHSHTGLKLQDAGGPDYGQERDDHDRRFLKVRTEILHLLHWGVESEKRLISQGPPAHDGRWAQRAHLVAGAVDRSEATSAVGGRDESSAEVAEIAADKTSESLSFENADLGSMPRDSIAGSGTNQIQSPAPVEEGLPLHETIFEGGGNSLVAIAVGSAEGTRTPSGGKTRHYRSHIDPGNGVMNIGTFSYQHHGGKMSPEQADRAQLERLQGQFKDMRGAANFHGMELTLKEALNGIDLANQAPATALGQRKNSSYIDLLFRAKTEFGLEGDDAIAFARTYAYQRLDESWDAPGLCLPTCNTVESVRKDQNRRMKEVNRAISESQYAGDEIAVPKPVKATEISDKSGELPEENIEEIKPKFVGLGEWLVD